MKPVYKYESLGCPAANGRGPCAITCGGGWPGTLMSNEALASAVRAGAIIADNLGCEPITQRVKSALEEQALLFQAEPVPIQSEAAV